MKKLIVIILFALCSVALAEPTQIDTVGNNSKVAPSDLQTFKTKPASQP